PCARRAVNVERPRSLWKKLPERRCLCRKKLSAFFALQHRLSEFAAVEEREVLDLLAGADEARGELQLVANGDDDAAFSRAVELRADDPGEVRGGVKFARLREGVRAGGGVHDEERLVRRGGVGLLQDALHFAELGHEVVLRVQTAGSVAEDELD